jgi:hypothetical protein
MTEIKDSTFSNLNTTNFKCSAITTYIPYSNKYSYPQTNDFKQYSRNLSWDSEVEWELDNDKIEECEDENGSDNDKDIDPLDKVIPNGELTYRQANYIWRLSWLSLGTTLYAIKQKKYDLALCPGGVFLTSLNYWRNPIPGFRKTLDIGYVLLACSYQLVRAQQAEYATQFYTTCALGLGSFCIGIYNHFKKKYWASIKWHGALHVFGNISSIILYSGYVPPICLLCLYRNNIKKLLDNK